MVVLSSFAAFALAAGPAPVPVNPLAMAEKGFLQCQRPNVQKKTCQSFSFYRRMEPGVYDTKIIFALAAEGPTTLEIHSRGVVKDGAVCRESRAEDFLAGIIRVGGSPVPAKDARPILEQFAQGTAPFAHKEICTRYEPSAHDFTARMIIAGKYQPSMDQVMKWISTADGYTLAP
jgi:hypothetical protein